MYLYTMQAMPGYKAQFEGDTSVRYKIRRENTSASAKTKKCTDIRLDLGYVQAAELVNKFNAKEREALAISREKDFRPMQGI
jgi:hypothetical protein